MRNLRRIVFFVFFSFFAELAFCEESKVLEAFSRIEIENNVTCVVIESDYNGAEVFINGSFLGYTPLKVQGFVPGDYRLCVRKDGFYEENFWITAKASYELLYKVSLRKLEVFEEDAFGVEAESSGVKASLGEEEDSDETVVLADCGMDAEVLEFENLNEVSLFGSTFFGSTVGAVPVVCSQAVRVRQVFLQTDGIFNANINSTESTAFGVEGISVCGGICLGLFKWLEVSAGGRGILGGKGNFLLGAGLKYSDSVEIKSRIFFNWGALLHYGFSSEKNNLSFDCGAGLGLALIGGFSLNRMNLHFAEEYILGAENGVIFAQENALKTQIAFSYRATERICAGLWSSLNSKIDWSSTESKMDFFNAMDMGFEVNFVPFDAPFIFSLRLKAMLFVKSLYLDYYTCGLGFSYLF